ncbi:MAG: MFS transporter [Pseudomonadota bacterium]
MAGPMVTGDAPREEVTGGPLGKKGIGWAIFEFARNPYYNAIVISVYAPFFARSVVGDPVEGQSMVSLAITIAGMIMAICAPILGTLVDKGGYRKPPVAMALGTLGLTTACLWFVRPGMDGAVPLGMALMATGYVTYTIAELFHNAMLPMAGRSKALPMISGLGLGLGNFGGLSTLILIGVFLTNPEIPVLGLDKETFQEYRIVGPFIAAWLVIFVLPFFLFMPDINKTADHGWRKAARATFSSERGLPGLFMNGINYTISMFRTYPNIMRYLVGRMLYADGITALLTIGSVYVGGFLGWSGTQLIAYNVMGGIFAVLGAFLGGFLDQRLGPKRALQIELSFIIALLLFQLSITPDSLLFGLIPAGHVIWEGGLFQTLSDVVYILLVIPVALMLTACISSSRYMLVHIAPPDQIGQFFGFYAMAGSVTVFLGPGLIYVMTTLSGSQRIGISMVGVLFIVGLWVISGVKADKTPEHMKVSGEATDVT